MPNMNHATDILRVKQIAIDEDGQRDEEIPPDRRGRQLKNTLLFAIHRRSGVLSMQVPGGLLDAYEQARISQVLMRSLRGPGVLSHRRQRFGQRRKVLCRRCPTRETDRRTVPEVAQAAITYFGILVSDCKVVIQEPDVDVLVVEVIAWEPTTARRVDLGEAVRKAQLARSSLLSVPPRLRPDGRQKALSSSCKTTLLIS